MTKSTSWSVQCVYYKVGTQSAGVYLRMARGWHVDSVVMSGPPRPQYRGGAGRGHRVCHNTGVTQEGG